MGLHEERIIGCVRWHRDLELSSPSVRYTSRTQLVVEVAFTSAMILLFKSVFLFTSTVSSFHDFSTCPL